MSRVRKLVYLDNERHVLDAIINFPANKWENIPEYRVLTDHFKGGGAISDINYFYSNINKIANYRRGNGFNLVYIFCRNSLRKRLPIEVENKLFEDVWKNYHTAKFGYKYAKYVARGRLSPEAEKNCNNIRYVLFLKNKKLEFESVLMNNPCLCFQFYRCCFYLSDNVHNCMIAYELMGNYHAKRYFIQRKKDDQILKNRLSVIDPNKSVADFLRSL